MMSDLGTTTPQPLLAAPGLNLGRDSKGTASA